MGRLVNALRCEDCPMPRGVYIGWIIIDPSVELKIRSRAGGGCTSGEVREAFQGREEMEIYQRC